MKCCYECENLRSKRWLPTNNKFEWRCTLAHYVDDVWEEHDCPDFVQGYEDEEHALQE
mgnify:FL=1